MNVMIWREAAGAAARVVYRVVRNKMHYACSKKNINTFLELILAVEDSFVPPLASSK